MNTPKRVKYGQLPNQAVQAPPADLRVDTLLRVALLGSELDCPRSTLGRVGWLVMLGSSP